MATGLYPHQHGITGNDPWRDSAIPADVYAQSREKLISKIDQCATVPALLAEQGYLTFADNIRQEALDQAVLSRRGFLLLSSASQLPSADSAGDETMPPSVIEASRLNIAQLRRAAAEEKLTSLSRSARSRGLSARSPYRLPRLR